MPPSTAVMGEMRTPPDRPRQAVESYAFFATVFCHSRIRTHQRGAALRYSVRKAPLSPQTLLFSVSGAIMKSCGNTGGCWLRLGAGFNSKNLLTTIAERMSATVFSRTFSARLQRGILYRLPCDCEAVQRDNTLGTMPYRAIREQRGCESAGGPHNEQSPLPLSLSQTTIHGGRSSRGGEALAPPCPTRQVGHCTCHRSSMAHPETRCASAPTPLHATLAIAGVKLDRVVPEQLALGGLRQIPAQYGLHRLGKPALPMRIV